MSVHRRKGKLGTTYQVKWREGGRARSQSFRGDGARVAAKKFDAEVGRRKFDGLPAPVSGGKETLDEFLRVTWLPLRGINLSDKTLGNYEWIWGKYVGPAFGSAVLREITAERIGHWRAEMLGEGRGARVVHDAVQILGSVLQLAVDTDRIVANPVRKVSNPLPKRKKPEVRPLVPAEVERLRACLAARDAAAVGVMAYAGLRPGETWALAWGDVKERTIRVYSQKTETSRSVSIRPEVQRTLDEWRLIQGGGELIFPDATGKQVTEEGHKSWGRHQFRDGVIAAGLDVIEPNVTPYTLRHSCASLLLHEGRSVIEVARWMGHSPVMTLRVYGHVMDDLVGGGHVKGDDLIVEARSGALDLSP